jgi:beta-carotene 3-hydroxylase
MNWFTDILITIASFAAMEAVAWFAHKYIMHGIGWYFHKDHHKRESAGFFERNDFFFLVFALPGIIGLYFGMQADYNILFWIGLGITVYGFAYFMVHDVFIHQRLKLLRKTDNTYFKAIRRAHKIHHKHLAKEHGECFGMLWVPVKYFKEASKSSDK